MVLEEIRIDSLGVIEDATLELGPGLTAITGETGAGKTLVVTALSLLLGQRADSGAVRSGARRARVEGVVATEALPAFAAEVDEAGGEVEDARVVLARDVQAGGRSRAFVGGAAVPVGRLAGLAEPLVAVHGQSDQHRLLQPAAQRDALDSFGGAALTSLRDRYAALHADLTATERLLADLVASGRERVREADLLAHGLAEVAAADPRPGEDVALAAEESRLGFADDLRRAAEEAREALSSDLDAPDALGAVSAARARLGAVRGHDPEAGELADRLAEAGYLVADLAADVARYAAGLDTDPRRLAAVSERRATLTALTRRYGASVDEVLAWAADAARRLADLQGADDRVAELRARRAGLRSSLAAAAGELSRARSARAQELAERVTAELRALAMPHATVTVEVRQREVPPPAAAPTREGPGATREPPGPAAPLAPLEPLAQLEPLEVGGRHLWFGPTGVDEVELLLAANAGAEPRPLARGASGGELSRVMLALEVVLAGTSPVPTFVFDEVDAGVGGRAAVEIGRRLGALARTAQVLVVTHLPQVAAYADRHVVVTKADDGTVTSSGLTVLDETGRQRELSRMLAGLEDSDTALAHARELLATARAGRDC